MKQEEILEYNKRCAEFLGWKQIKDLEIIVEENEHLKDCWYLPYTELVFWNTDVLKFSTDWNWIMDVVESIEKLGYKFQLGWNITALISLVPNTPAKIALIESENRKEAVVQAINQFLIWYTENNK